MPVELLLRPERPEDHAALAALVTAAFDGKPYADGDEAELLGALRVAGALTLSFVAEESGVLVGQAAFSPARAADGTPGWYALGPVAVAPARQGVGIGTKLVLAGLTWLAHRGAAGCILVGDPGYYERFGFVRAPENAPAGMPAEYFMVKVLGGPRPAGPIAFHEAFGGTG